VEKLTYRGHHKMVTKQQYKTDEYGKDILLKDNKYQVMMSWEQNLMEKCIDELNPINGDVLEIGFGMGYSAKQIQKYKPKSHTIIEMDSMVINKAKTDLGFHSTLGKYDNIKWVHGTWQERLNELGKFDYIFFDDYPLEQPKDDFQKKLVAERFFMFIDICLDWHLNEGGKISAYLHDPERKFKDRVMSGRNIEYYEKEIDIDVPDNCNYYRDNKGIIPIIIKL